MSDPYFQTLFAERIGGANYGKGTEIYKFEKIKRAKRKALADFPNRPLIDFGIGGLSASQSLEDLRQSGSHALLQSEAVRGAYTPLDAAPEQIRRARGQPADPRDDVHALGVIWFQMATGKLDLLQIPPDWADDLRTRGMLEEQIAIIGACIASNQDKRPADADYVILQDPEGNRFCVIDAADTTSMTPEPTDGQVYGG